MINTTTPGIPKKPAISAEIGFIGSEKLTFIPIKLRFAIRKFATYNIITPIIPFTITFIGHFNNFANRHNIITPINAYIKYCGSMLSPPYFIQA